MCELRFLVVFLSSSWQVHDHFIIPHSLSFFYSASVVDKRITEHTKKHISCYFPLTENIISAFLMDILGSVFMCHFVLLDYVWMALCSGTWMCSALCLKDVLHVLYCSHCLGRILLITIKYYHSYYQPVNF
jgi:hypothetical protein